METNILGESKIYFPNTNEVYVDNSGAMNASDELLSVFLFGRIDDLGLSLAGYSLKSTETLEAAHVKKP